MSIKIAPDKKKHFVVGIPLGIFLQLVASYFFSGLLIPILLAFFVLSLICYGFELFSLITGKGHADNMDAIAGILGGIVGLGIYWGMLAIR
ncbi:MAG: hypothetical protein ABJB11_22750 [Ferruginibacter sp.]